MKRHLTILILVLMSLHAVAQQFDWDDPNINYEWDNNRHTVTIYAGYNSLVGIMTQPLYTDILAKKSSFANLTFNSNVPYGNYGIQYHYNILKWLRVGFKISNDINKITLDQKTHNLVDISLLASVQFTYMNRNKWRIYSGVDIGESSIFIVDFDETIYFPSFNITPLGFSYGRAFVLFMETNLGTDAIIKGGIGLRL